MQNMVRNGWNVRGFKRPANVISNKLGKDMYPKHWGELMFYVVFSSKTDMHTTAPNAPSVEKCIPSVRGAHP